MTGEVALIIDFAHPKRQLPLKRVLDHLGLTSRQRGSGPQKGCACPIHRGDARGRTFSLREAALDLVRTIHLRATP
jgi:hypothetical protein